MAEKIGRLEFDGQPVDIARYKDFLADYLPKGKINTVSFQMTNYRPYKALGDKQMVLRATGERQLPCFDTVSFPVWNSEDEEFVQTDGLLRYYETVSKRKMKDGMTEDFAPVNITFERGMMTFSSKNNAKILFLLFHSENGRNKLSVNAAGNEEGWSQKMPLFNMILQTEKNKKFTASVTDKNRAFTLVNKLKETDRVKLRNIYEACGFSDWDIHILKNGVGDWDAILAPLYQITDTSPEKILAFDKDALLDMRALVTQAIEGAYITYENSTFLWGPKAMGGKFINKEVKEKIIVKAPVGKQAKDIARVWFVDWLDKNPDVFVEIKTDISNAALG